MINSKSEEALGMMPERRDEILERAAIYEFDAGMSRFAAMNQAIADGFEQIWKESASKFKQTDFFD